MRKKTLKTHEENLKERNGITLIALVITIIVLLILAGISISMLSGDNGILQKATDAKTNTERAEIVENAKIDVSNEITENKGKDLQESQLKDVLKKYFVNSEIPEELPSDLSTVELTTQNQKYKIKVSEIYDDNFTKQSSAALAKDKLIVNTSASTDEEKSPYVNYTDANGNTILCRVLYNDETNGLQIISSNSITTITLGYEDTQVTVSDFVYEGTAILDDNFRISASSYNMAITTLNEKSEEYLDLNGIAYKARCVGSNPINSSDITETSFTSTRSYMTTYSLQKKFKVNDTNYQTDFDQMGNLGIRTSDSVCWLASRTAGATASDASFYIKGLNTNGSINLSRLCYVNSNGTNGSYSYTYGLRPIFHLSDGVKITSGSGTKSDPYTLGI